MELRSLIKLVDDIESNAPSIKKYIAEGVYNTPEMQKHWKRLDEGFFKGYDKYLSEVALTPDQIQNIFKQASGGAAGADPAKDPGKLAAIVDKVLPTSQAASLEKSLPDPAAGPVQGFEQKASAAVQNLPGVDSGTKQSLMQLVKAGIKKPETQQLILAAVGAGLGSLISKVGPILSMIPGGGPIASAVTGAIVAGGVAVIAAKLRGEDWKSAFKGAIKPALMGGAAAVIGNLATSAVAAVLPNGNSADAPANTDEPQQRRGAASGDMKPGDFDKMSQTPTNPDGSPMTPDQINQIKADQLAGGGMKNGDGTPMTNADMRKYMDQVAPISGSDADPNKYYNSLSPDQQRATDDAVVAQAQAAGKPPSTNPILGKDTYPDGTPVERRPGMNSSPEYMAQFGGEQPNQGGGITPRLPPGASLSDFSNTGGGSDNPTGAGPRQGDLKIPVDNLPGGANNPVASASQQADWANGNNPPPEWVKNNQTGKYEPPGGPADWANGNNPPPEWVKNSSTGKYEPPGGPADWANGNNPPPEWIKNNATGKYEPPTSDTATQSPAAPQGAAMDPEYLKKVAAGEPGRHMISAEKAQAALDWQAQNGGQVQPPKGTWSDGGRNSYPGGLAQYYKDNPGIRENAIDKQATLREWLKKDQRGIAINSVQLNPVFVEGIMDSLKGMFGGKKGAAAPAAGGTTADALNKAWTDAGSPTDSEEVAKVLQGAGVPAETVTKIFTDLKIPAPGATPTPAAATEPAATQTADPAAQTPAPAPSTTPTTQEPASTQPAPTAGAQPGSPAATTQATTPAAEPPATPAAQQQSKVGVGQINKIIPTLRVRDLKSVQKNVDGTLAKRQTAKQPTAEGKYVGFYSKFLDKEI